MGSSAHLPPHTTGGAHGHADPCATTGVDRQAASPPAGPRASPAGANARAARLVGPGTGAGRRGAAGTPGSRGGVAVAGAGEAAGNHLWDDVPHTGGVADGRRADPMAGLGQAPSHPQSGAVAVGGRAVLMAVTWPSRATRTRSRAARERTSPRVRCIDSWRSRRLSPKQ